MGCQHPPRFRNLLVQKRMVLSLRYICTTHMLLFIGMMFYLASNTRPDISLVVHQCAQFTHHTKASYDMDVKSIFHYFQCTKDKGLVLNPSKKMVVD